MSKTEKNIWSGLVLKENGNMLRAISEFNRSYRLLAQRTLKEGDIKGGHQVLGMSDEIAVLISHLTEVQIERLSDRSDLLCKMRVSVSVQQMART